MATVLVCDNVTDEGLEVVAAEHEVIVAGDWSRAEVLGKVGFADALVVRSATVVDAEMVDAGTRLRVIARAGVGIDNIDVATATRRGAAGQSPSSASPPRKMARSGSGRPVPAAGVV